MNGMLAAIKEVDEETMGMLKEILKALFEIAGAQMRQEVTKNVQAGKEKLKKPGKPKLSPRQS